MHAGLTDHREFIEKLPDGLTLHVETDEAVTAVPSQLQQLLENLFRNAREHAGDPVRVTAGPLEAESGFYVRG